MKNKKKWIIGVGSILIIGLCIIGVLAKKNYDEAEEQEQANLISEKITSEYKSLSNWGELTVDNSLDKFIFTFYDDEFSQEFLENIKNIDKNDVDYVMDIIETDDISDLDGLSSHAKDITSDMSVNLEIYRITVNLGMWNIFVDKFSDISKEIGEQQKLSSYGFLVYDPADNESPIFEANNGNIIYNIQEDLYYPKN